MKNPLVSVIVPTKNSKQFLEACLKSIAEQTYTNIELIVVDNDSTDETKEIAKKYADQVLNKGPERSAQVNYGVKKSKGVFVYKIDSDFVLDPEVIEQCIEKVKSGCDAVVVHNSPDTSVSWIARVRKFEVDMYKYDITHSSARFVRKEVYEAIGGFNEKITAGEDYDFQNKLNRAGYKTGFVEAEALHLGEPTKLWKHMKKYYEYGKDFVNYKENNPKESRAQLGFLRSTYAKNWPAFLRQPVLAATFVFYNLLKFTFGGLGYFYAKISNSKEELPKYKSLVPELVSLETEMRHVKGFHLSENFDFFTPTSEKHPFHYKIRLNNKIKTPELYDFRSENFIKAGNRWFYEKKFGFLDLKFYFDSEKREFEFNRAYSLLPFRIGGVFLAGEHIASFIYLELFLKNYVVMRGSAISHEGQVYCISAPGFNGKTNFITQMLRSGANYLAEDNLIIDVDHNQVYPSCPFLTNDIWHRRDTNNRLATFLSAGNIIEEPKPIFKLVLVQNSMRTYATANKLFLDFLLLNSLYFLGDLFTRSVIFEDNLTDQVLNRITQNFSKLKPSFVSIKGFNYKEAINNERHTQP